MIRLLTLLPAILLAMLCSTTLAETPSFQGLGDLPGGDVFSWASAVSADGTTVVGSSWSDLPHEAFRWTAGEAMVGLGAIPSYHTASVAHAVSADGSVVAGNSSGGFVWTTGAGIVELEGPAENVKISTCQGISDDGSLVVGRASFGIDDTQAYYRTAETGPVPLGHFGGINASSEALGVSPDGRTIVGTSSWMGHESMYDFRSEAFHWTAADGMIGLGHLPGIQKRSEALDVSADGAVVIGWSDAVGVDSAPFRWTAAGGMVMLPALGGDVSGCAYGITPDGATIVGRSGDAAVIWPDGGSVLSVQEMLTDVCGLQLDGWTLEGARGISADGLTIVGYGTNPDGNIEAWVATIPEPATGSLVLLGLLAAVSRRRR